MATAERAQRVLDAIARAGAHLPGQAPLDRFIHFISFQGDLPLGFEAAARAGWLRRGARAWPSDTDGRAGLAAGRFRVDDLRVVLAETPGLDLDAPAGVAGGRQVREADLWLARLEGDCAPLSPPALRDRLSSGLAASASDASAALRGRPANEVLPSLWRSICERLALGELTTVPDPVPDGSPARTRRARHAWATERLDALAHGVGPVHDLATPWRALTGRDLNAEVDAALAPRLAAALDAGVAAWAAPPSVPAGEAAAHLIVDALEALGVPEAAWEALIERELMRAQGAAGLLAWMERQGGGGIGLSGWMAARFSALRERVTEVAATLQLAPHLASLRHLAERAPDAAVLRLALHDHALPDSLVPPVQAWLEGRSGPPRDAAAGQLAHAWWSWRERAQVAAWERAAREAWPLYQLAIQLGADANDVQALSDAHLGRWATLPERADDPARGMLWLRAAERAYQEDVLHALSSAPAPEPPMRAAACFCIDDREESLRRHLEELDPSVHTFSMVGFFGLPIRYRGHGASSSKALCPVVVQPRFDVEEVPREGETPSPLTWTVKVQAWFGLTPPPRHGTRLRADPALTDEVAAGFVADALLGMGLRRPPPIVALLGHGASSVNNPYAASYDCGACSGQHGGPNARLLASLANHPEVRARLGALGVDLSLDPCFVAGEHDTTTDRLAWFDLVDLPEARRPAFAALRATLEAACGRSARERCRRLPGAPWPVDEAAALAHVGWRALDFSQPRPELGHTGNALAVVGRRALTRGLFLDRRAFLVSYDPALDDAAGTVLERLLMGAGPVGAQINFDYTLSALDRDVLGAGSKAGQNLIGLSGVLQGGEGDLRTGLPWQMVEQHEAMRLLLVIDAPLSRVVAIYQRNDAIRTLVDGAWLLLAVRAPDDGAIWRFLPGVGLMPWAPTRGAPPRRADSFAWIGEARGPLPVARLDVSEVTRG